MCVWFTEAHLASHADVNMTMSVISQMARLPKVIDQNCVRINPLSTVLARKTAAQLQSISLLNRDLRFHPALHMKSSQGLDVPSPSRQRPLLSRSDAMLAEAEPMLLESQALPPNRLAAIIASSPAMGVGEAEREDNWLPAHCHAHPATTVNRSLKRGEVSWTSNHDTRSSPSPLRLRGHNAQRVTTSVSGPGKD